MKKTTTDVIKDYNQLAMSMPLERWTPKFAHARMEQQSDDAVHLQFNIWVPSIRNFVPQDEIINVQQAPNELKRLRARAQGEPTPAVA